MSVWDTIGMTPSQASTDIGGIGIGIGAVGTAMGLSSGLEASGYESQAYDAQKQQAALEMQVNAQRKQQMELMSSRQSIENLRNVQKAQSLGLTAATASGSQFGSGLQGAQASQTSQGAYNALGIGQNLSIGRNIFSLDDQISEQKMAYATALSNANTAKGQQSMWGGIANIGMDLLKAAPYLAAL